MFKTTVNDVENTSPPGRNPGATREPSENARAAAEAHFPAFTRRAERAAHADITSAHYKGREHGR